MAISISRTSQMSQTRPRRRVRAETIETIRKTLEVCIFHQLYFTSENSILQEHQNDELRAGDLVAFTAPNTAWFAKCIEDVSPESQHLLIRWVEPTTRNAEVSFSCDDHGPTKCLPRLSLLGPLKPLLSKACISVHVHKLLLQLGNDDFIKQQPLNVGDEALPSFRESQEAGFLQLKYMFPLLIIAPENDVRFPLTEQQELQNLSENLIFARQHLTKVRTNSSNESY